MEHPTTIHTEHHNGGTKEIWRTFWILLALTIVELVFGFVMIGIESQGWKHFIKGVIIILMLAKAFYIVAYFMHLKGEIKNLVMTIIVPLLLFVWFIIAFLADGNSYRNLRNNYDPYHKEQSTKPAPAQQHEEHRHDAVKPGEKD